MYIFSKVICELSEGNVKSDTEPTGLAELAYQ